MEVKQSLKSSNGPNGNASARKSFLKSESNSYMSKKSEQKSVNEGENLFKQPVRVQPRKSFGGVASKRPSTRQSIGGGLTDSSGRKSLPGPRSSLTVTEPISQTASTPKPESKTTGLKLITPAKFSEHHAKVISE